MTASAVSSVNSSLAIRTPPNIRLQLRADPIWPLALAREKECEFAPAHLFGDVSERCERIAVAHRVRIAARRQVKPDAVCTPDLDARVDDFEHQPRAVLDWAAVGVGAKIRAVLQELVEEIAVGAVDFDAVEPCALGVLGAAAIFGNDAGNFAEIERARHDVVAHRAHQADVAFRRDGAGRDRQCASEIVGMRDASDMPELQEDGPTCRVHGFRDALPARDLFLRPDARRIGIADAHRPTPTSPPTTSARRTLAGHNTRASNHSARVRRSNGSASAEPARCGSEA